jgi:hypothetical protein
MCGPHLFYDVTLDGGWLFVSAQLMDRSDPPQSLLSVADGPEGWQTLCRLVEALERNKIKSLERPIEAGEGRHGFVTG